MQDAQHQPCCTSDKRPAQQGLKPSSKSRPPVHFQRKKFKKRARVDIGLAFKWWRELKLKGEMRSDAEVALYLLKTMKRSASRSATPEACAQKIKFSQAEVEALIRQEVCTAVKKSESKLEGFIARIQQLDREIDYERSIRKLEARINTVTKRAEAALAHIAKTAQKSPAPSPVSPVNEDIRRKNSEDETMETVSETENKSSDNSKELLQVMETTKKALKKMNADKVGNITPAADCNSLKRTDSKEDKLSYPPLPPTPFPSVLSMEAASYNIPQRLEVQLALIRNPPGLSVLWKVEKEDPCAPPMDSYSVLMSMEKVKGSGVFPDWITLGEVVAIPLPICVLISKYKPGHKVCFTVVGKDNFGRYGPYSRVVTAAIPDLLEEERGVKGATTQAAEVK